MLKFLPSKGKQDAKRGKLFTKLIREITVAARLGGGDPDANPRLRAAIDSGLSKNMTKDTIERAVKRSAGGDESGNVDELRFNVCLILPRPKRSWREMPNRI